jgi:phosphohistidine phosphatase
MKRLALLRHAKSSRDEPDRDDFDRPLTGRGWKAARRIGRELKQRKMRFDLCVASPAARVRETLDGFTEGYCDLPFPVQFDQRIYMASCADLLGILMAVEDEVQTLLIGGHNPGLEELALELTREDESGLRNRVEHKFPTAAFALIDLPADRWADVQVSSGVLTELILPKELD